MRQASDLLPVGVPALLTLLAACGGDGAGPPVGPEDPDPTPAVRSIQVWPCGCFSYSGGPERTIGVLGTQVRFKAVALAQDGTVLYTSTQNPDRFSWSSSSPDVAPVEVTPGPFGGVLVLVTGVSEGTATVTAASEGVSGEITVTVRDRARLAWSVPLSGESADAGIAIGADGTIYAVTADRAANRSRLSALSPQGSVLWSLDLPLTDRSMPAIGHDGTLYLGSRTLSEPIASVGRLIAVDAGGAVRWMVENLHEIRSSPAIGPDGTIYVAGGRHVYAIDPRGEVRWDWEHEHRVFFLSSPAVASDGTIYVGGDDGFLYALNTDGSLQSTFEAGDRIRSSPSIGRDGTIYFGSIGGLLYAIGPDGSGREVLLDGSVGSPSIGADGTVHVGVGGRSGMGVFAVDPAGSVRWSSGPGTSSTPVLGADGTVYVTGTGPSGEPVIAALDSQGRLQWDYVVPGEPQAFGPASPAIGLDGMILALTRDPAVLYAIVENDGRNGGNAGAPWPTGRGDRTNSGRAGG